VNVVPAKELPLLAPLEALPLEALPLELPLAEPLALPLLAPLPASCVDAPDDPTPDEPAEPEPLDAPDEEPLPPTGGLAVADPDPLGEPLPPWVAASSVAVSASSPLVGAASLGVEVVGEFDASSSPVDGLPPVVGALLQATRATIATTTPAR
jgi:hypothetical protein